MTALHLLCTINQVVIDVLDLVVLLTVLSPLLQLLDTSPATAGRVLPALLVRVISPHLTELADTLREVDVDPPVVYQNVLHLEVCRLARRLVFILDEGILQAIARLAIPDNLTAEDLAKPTKDQFQVAIRGDRVQLANEKYVFRRSDLGKRQVAHHLQG